MNNKIIQSKIERRDKMFSLMDKLTEMENKENQKFLDYQDKRIIELNNMLDRQSKGEFIDVSDIIQDFIDSGIVNKNKTVNDCFSKIFSNKR